MKNQQQPFSCLSINFADCCVVVVVVGSFLFIVQNILLANGTRSLVVHRFHIESTASCLVVMEFLACSVLIVVVTGAATAFQKKGCLVDATFFSVSNTFAPLRNCGSYNAMHVYWNLFNLLIMPQSN